MNYLEKVEKGIDFIETNLSERFSLADVACAAGISQWHFQRIFKALSNETLKSYIRSRRLSVALHKLLNNNKRIIDIAFESGFESQESFSRAFKMQFHLTPNHYRKLANKNLFLDKIKFDAKYLNHINQNTSKEPEIYQQKAMTLVGMKTLFYSTDSEKNNIAEKIPPLWNQFLAQLNRIKNRVPNVCYGIIQPSDKNSELLEYYAVAEVTKSDEIPKDMVVYSLAKAQYAKFTHKGRVKNLDNTVNYIYSNWLLRVKYQHSYAADIEVYGQDYHPTSSGSTIHYAIPIEPV